MTDSTNEAVEEIERETGVNLAALVAGIAVLKKRNDAAARYALHSILAAAPAADRRPT